MVRSLDKKWKEFLFAFSGFGPNLLMILMGCFYDDALNPNALEGGNPLQAIVPGVCLILPILSSVLFMVAKIFDGIIDIPFAHITDTLSTKWGRRRPAIAVCLLPMILSYAMCWIMPGGEGGQLFNTIWATFWSFVFFATYTMCLIAFYGSLSSVCTDEPQRLRVSGYKSFFDTITYCLVYALVPVILSALNIHIDRFVFLLLPVMLTMLIPLFLIKEGKRYGYPENEGLISEKISIGESIKLTFKNRIFRRWLYVNACTFFGLQMFLSGMNGLIIGGMGLEPWHMSVLNTCAFAPVPVMLYLFNKVKARFGVRRAYQSCLFMFAVSIMSFFFASRLLLGEGNEMLKIIIGAVGGVAGSWSIGVFFMMPYLAPAQISSVEERLTGKNHSAMYFAGNAVVTSIVGAISGQLVYGIIKNLFVSKSVPGIVYAETVGEAMAKLGVGSEAELFNLGNLLVPFIVSATCIAGLFLAFKLPRDFTPTILARAFKEMDPTLDISEIEKEEVVEEKGEILFVQIGLSVLSGFIFGFIWTAFLLRSVKEMTGRVRVLLLYLCSVLIPFAGIYTALKCRSAIIGAAGERGADIKISKAALIISFLVFPILPMNLISLALLQRGTNKLAQVA